MDHTNPLVKPQKTPFFYIIHFIAQAVIIIGALNWGYVGLKGHGFVDEFVSLPTFHNLIYIAVGIAGFIQMFHFLRVFGDMNSHKPC